MALGRRKREQRALLVATTSVAFVRPFRVRAVRIAAREPTVLSSLRCRPFVATVQAALERADPDAEAGR